MTRLIRAFTLAALVGCGSGAAESSVDERPVVKAATVSEVVFGDDLKISATLSAHQVATLAPSLPARVSAIHVRIGDEVEKGDILVELDAATFRQAVRQGEAAEAMARAGLAQAEANLARFESLSGQSAVTQAEFEQVQTAVAMARAQLAQAEAGAQVAREQLANARLRAPFDGVITARNLELGEMVAGPSPMGPPIQMADMSKIRVKGELGELHASRLSVGTTVQVSVDALIGETFEAVIDRVNPAVDARSRSVAFEALIDEPDPRLRHGMAGTVHIEGGGEPLLAVPRLALLDRDDGEARVFVLTGTAIAERPVRYGRSTSDFVPIVSGLDAGERVLVAGHNRLTGEEQVEVIE